MGEAYGRRGLILHGAQWEWPMHAMLTQHPMPGGLRERFTCVLKGPGTAPAARRAHTATKHCLPGASRSQLPPAHPGEPKCQPWTPEYLPASCHHSTTRSAPLLLPARGRLEPMLKLNKCWIPAALWDMMLPNHAWSSWTLEHFTILGFR